MKNKVLIIALGIVIMVLIVAAVIFRGNKEPDVTFETVRVEASPISSVVTATGTIEAITTIDVGTQVSGIIQKIYADFNDNVRKGQLLAKLDETNLREQLRQSEASLAQAQAQLTFNEATYKRMKALYDKELVAESDYDQALFNYENSKASVTNAQSAVSRAKVNLDYATITSPIDGIVLNRAVEEGQTVAASFTTPTLFTIVNDLTRMEVQTSVDEADIGKVKEGQRVEFTVDTYLDRKFEGNVSQVRLQPVTTNNVVTYMVILSAQNPDKELMPGMTASASIFTEEKKNALVLPGKAVRFKPSDEYFRNLVVKWMKNNGIKGGRLGKMPSDTADLARLYQGIIPQGMASGQRPAGTTPEMGGELRGISQGGVMQNLQLPADKKMVWIKGGDYGAYMRIITTGIDNGINIEVLDGLEEGDEVIVSMTGGSSPRATASNSSRSQGGFPF